MNPAALVTGATMMPAGEPNRAKRSGPAETGQGPALSISLKRKKTFPVPPVTPVIQEQRAKAARFTAIYLGERGQSTDGGPSFYTKETFNRGSEGGIRVMPPVTRDG